MNFSMIRQIPLFLVALVLNVFLLASTVYADTLFEITWGGTANGLTSIDGATEQSVAHDFTATSDWQVTEIRWTGLFRNTIQIQPTRDFTIDFYTDENGVPAEFPFNSFLVVANSTFNTNVGSTINAYNFSAPLAAPLTVPNGTKLWMSITDRGPDRSGGNGIFWAADSFTGSGTRFRTGDSGAWTGLDARDVNFALIGTVVATVTVGNTTDSGPGSLREAITVANSDGVPTIITFDPNVFPPFTPCAAPYLPFPPLPHDFFGPYGPNVAAAPPGTIVLDSQLPNITGTGDSIDGSGACAVIDGRNLPSQTGLRIRASNVTIQGLTLQNFIGNDAVRVEARDSTPEVTGVLIRSNQFYRNRRAVLVTGGFGTMARTVRANVSLNTIQDVESGVSVLGNATGDTGPGNRVDAMVGNNLVQGTFTPVAGVRGDGINVSGATDVGSNNEVNVTVGVNTVRDVIDDGITAGGCGRDDTGSNNFVQAIITFNTVAHFINGQAPEGIINRGIIVFGSGGESAAISNCTDNTIRFLVSNNTVNGFPNANITISGGDEGTSGNDLSGDILDNTVMNSRSGTGISVTPGSGQGHFVHDVTIGGNKVSGNARRGIIISGASSTDGVVTRIIVSGNTIDGKPPPCPPNQSPQNCVIPDATQDGIIVTGSSSAVNASLSEILIDSNITKNSQRFGIIVTRGNEPTNSVSISGITNNLSTRNSRDGIIIASNVPGSGNTPVVGNQCNDNGEDGIDVNSPGYSLSNNSCSKNVADGINAVVGNTNDGGNSGRRNGDCNEPNFCFNTPL